jgi:DNA-binding MurR/RpiR family transcriptional regulator
MADGDSNREVARPLEATEGLDRSPLERRIAERMPGLTPAQARLSNFVLSRIEEAVFLSITQLGERVNASDATVSRYAAALGFDSFESFRKALQEHYHAKAGLSRRFFVKLNQAPEEIDFFTRVMSTEIEYLRRSCDTIAPGAIERAAAAIAVSRKTFLLAERPSWSLVDVLEFRLRRYGLDVVPVTEPGRYALDKARSFGERDAVVVLAFQRFSRDLERLLNLAHRRGTTIAVITDLSFIPGAVGDEILISAERGPVGASQSLLVPVAIAHALVLAVGASLGERGYAALDEIDRLRREYG